MTISDTTRQMLLANAERYETAEFLVGDPSWWMHQVEGVENQEAMAFLASCLSYGSRKQFMPKIGQLLEWSDGEVDNWLRIGAYRSHFDKGDTSCFYRLYNNDCMRTFLDAYNDLLNGHGTLGEYVSRRTDNGIGAVGAISEFFASHVSTVVPKDTSSACKRVCMFLRWMVRDNSPVDLGLWASFIDKRTLIMPLDTHVVSQSVRLGLLNSKAASMSAARRLTDVLAQVFPDDPLLGDFALFGYGVNGEE